MRDGRTQMIGLLLATGICTICAGGEHRVLATGYEEGQHHKINPWRNAEARVVKAEPGELVPDGRHYLAVQLGGVNEEATGGITLYLVPNTDRTRLPVNTVAVSAWVRGRGDNRMRPAVAMADGYRWLGGGHDGGIDLRDTDWVRLEFRLSEFARKDQPHEHPETFGDMRGAPYFCFYLYKNRDAAEYVVFGVDRIEYICDGPPVYATAD